MLKKRPFVPAILALIFFLPVSETFSQDTKEDPYSDYSHLWENTGKKKKKKNQQQTIVTDSVRLIPSDSLLSPADSLNLVQQDTINISPGTDEILTADTLDPQPVMEDPQIAAEEQEEPKKEKKEKAPSENDLPVDDFRAGMESSGGGSFTGGFTYTQIGDEAFAGLVLSPEFKIGKVGIGLNVPILYGLDSKSIRTEVFEDGAGPARLIRYIRYGVQKKDPVYVKFGELQGTMLGFGGLINNYTNSVSYEKRKVGLHYDLNFKGFVGVEGMYSDLDPASLNLLAIRPYVRPLSGTDIPIARTLEMGAIFITDKDQTSFPTSDSTSRSYSFTEAGMGAFGLDMGVTLVRVPFIQIDLFVNYSNLKINESDTLNQATSLINGAPGLSGGSGYSAGLNFRMHFIADVFSTDIRIERLTYKDNYLPQFFDATYELNKDLKILSLASAQEMSGIYGSLTGHVLQKVQLGGSLLIPDDISETSPAVVQVRADLERLADKYSFHGSYIKGNLTDLGDAFRFDERSLAKMRFIYHMNSFLATGLDYYWLFTPVADGSYEATKYVMPYVGVSIKF
ncbi:MAG: hypothetical protein RIM99_15555 [Cyclobacteriaceae bacterium]